MALLSMETAKDNSATEMICRALARLDWRSSGDEKFSVGKALLRDGDGLRRSAVQRK